MPQPLPPLIVPPPNCKLPQPCLYASWDDPYSACQEVRPMLWDRSCPDHVPLQLRHLVLGGRAAAAGGGGGAAEL